MPNRLADATSPYLLQHRDNPVDWWPWSAEAFAEAARRDVPVLLSVGYAACHWCHVMAHESFEDPRIARLVNAHTVPVKVDREERPDVDAVYMAATVAMTGQGGWPMTVFCTPAGEPFYCGTYFPPDAFGRLVLAVGQTWAEQRAEVVGHGRRVAEAIGRSAELPSAEEALSVAVLDAAADQLHAAYDRTNGGFGGAPKFPPAMALEFLLRHHARTGSAESMRVVEHTGERMARGGMYDQLAGGFARYAVDPGWVVPHFEKMLYDNALLLRFYARLWRATGSPLPRRVVEETAEFLLRDLRTPEGGFAAALDADAAGGEGSTYVWTPGQLRDALGGQRGRWAAELLSVTDAGTFEHGTSTLQLRTDPVDPAAWRQARALLLAVRETRPQPARDDKVVTAWNGLCIAGLAECGALLGEASYVAAAEEAAQLLLSRHVVDGRLRRTSRRGRVGPSAGVLEDYGDLVDGLLALHQATGGPGWLAAAEPLLDTALARFGDGSGGFFDTADDAEPLISRPRELTDHPTPSGTSALAGALVSFAALTGSARHRAAAQAALGRLAPIVAGHPTFAGWAAAVGEAVVAGPLQVAVVGGDPKLERAARHGTSPGAVVVAGVPDAPGVPLLADRPLVSGRPAAYVCRGFVCDLPITEPAALAHAVGALPARS